MTTEKQAKNQQREVEDETANETTPPIHFSITGFLRENYKLFTILSAFGALAGYQSTLPRIESRFFLKVGFVSTLFLLFITVIAINRCLYLEIGKIEGIIMSLLYPSRHTWKMIALFVPFNSLSISFIGATGDYLAIIVYLSQFVFLIGAFMSFFYISRLSSNGEVVNLETVEDRIVVEHTVVYIAISSLMIYLFTTVINRLIGGIYVAIIKIFEFNGEVTEIGTAILVGFWLSPVMILILSLSYLLQFIPKSYLD